MVKIEAFRAFGVVARHGNLRDAAEELGRTQSALSMTLGQLEQMLGSPLFETDRKRDLTDLGMFVRDKSEELIREHDRVQEVIGSYAKDEAGRLRIASVPSVAALVLPELLRVFLEDHPGARIELMDSDSTQVRSMVADGHADLGIAGPAPERQALHEEPLFHDTLQVVCHVESEFSGWRGPLSWSDLSGAALITNQTFLTLNSPDALAAVAKSRLSARNISSLFAMVDAGLGLTVLPGLATRSLSPNLKAIPLSDSSNTRAICLLSRNSWTESPVANAFRSYLLGQLPTLLDRWSLGSGRTTANSPMSSGE